MQHSKRNWEQEAQDMIGYFKPLSERVSLTNTEREWHLGLFMADQWLRLVQHSSPDKAEVLLFCNTMKSQKMNMGSGWHDLMGRAEMWAEAKNLLD